MDTIKIYNIDYEIDFLSINTWQSQGGDPFAFPIKIGNHTCFIKKFKEHPPKSKPLLEKLIGKEVAGISPIYGFFKGVEHDKNVYYAVQKLAVGEVMEKEFKQAELRSIDLLNFAQQIYRGLSDIHRQDYWHCDICFKNILIKNNDFTLIDIDSCLHKDETPNINLIINQDFFVNLYKYFKTNGYNLELTKLSGKQYNLLQLAVAVSHLSFMRIKKLNCSASAINETANHLSELNNDSIFEIFLKGLTGNLNMKDFEELISLLPKSIDLIEEKPKEKSGNFDILLNTSLNSGVLSKVGDTKTEKKAEKSVVQEKPINTKLNKSKQKITEIPIIKPTIEVKINDKNVNDFLREKTVLRVNDTINYSWKINHANEIILNGNIIKKVGSASMKVTENSNLRFVAKNSKPTGFMQTKKNISIPVDLTPIIKLFEINSKKNSRFTFKEGEQVIISWKVESANQIYLNNELISNYASGTKYMSFKKTEDIRLIAKYENNGISRTARSNIIKIFIPNTVNIPEVEIANEEPPDSFNNNIFEIEKLAINNTSIRNKRELNVSFSDILKMSYKLQNCTSLTINEIEKNKEKGVLNISNDVDKIIFHAKYLDENFNERLFKKELSIIRKKTFWQKIIDFFKSLF